MNILTKHIRLVLTAVLLILSCALPLAAVDSPGLQENEVPWETAAQRDVTEQYTDVWDPLGEATEGEVEDDTPRETDAPTEATGQGITEPVQTTGNTQSTETTNVPQESETAENTTTKDTSEADDELIHTLSEMIASVEQLKEQLDDNINNSKRLTSFIIIMTLAGVIICCFAVYVTYRLDKQMDLFPDAISLPQLTRGSNRAGRSQRGETPSNNGTASKPAEVRGASDAVLGRHGVDSRVNREPARVTHERVITAPYEDRADSERLKSASDEVMQCYLHGTADTSSWRWYEFDTSKYDAVTQCLRNNYRAYDHYRIVPVRGSRSYCQYVLIDGRYLFPNFLVPDAATPGSRLRQVFSTGKRYCLDAIFNVVDSEGKSVNIMSDVLGARLAEIKPALVEVTSDGCLSVTQMGEIVLR